ncbi:MAG: hypothetical protein E7258_05045 [Lachnospiraceae bacterium]|nr:hypothetical protein [Lachnospiraceae bacterium]
MLNLLRMNSYRARHMVCLYVLLAMVFAFGILSVSSIGMTAKDIKNGDYVDYDSMGEAIEDGWNEAEAEANSDAYNAGYEVGQEVALSIGLVSNQPIKADGTITSYLEYLYEDVTSGIVLLFMCIAMVLFFNREHSSGFIKNIATKSTSRINIYFTKFAVMTVYMLLVILVLAISEYICLMVYYDGDMVFGMNILGDFLGKMGIVFLLHIAFVSGVAMLTTVTRSSMLAMTIGILANTRFTSLIVIFVKAKFDYDLNKLLIMPNIGKVNLGMEWGDVSTSLLVGIVTIIVYNVIACTVFAKRDIA